MIALLFFTLFSTSYAHPLEVGASTQYKTEDNLGNYAFGYNEDHTSGGSFRKEYGDSLGNKVGSYGLHEADGRARVVNYVADSAGFRADVHTNEPGVDPTQDSADVTVNKAVVVAPAAAVVAPVVKHHAVAAPVVPVINHHVAVAPAVAVASHHAVSLLHPPVFHAPFAFHPFLAHGAHLVL